MEIINKPLKGIIPYVRNPVIHSDAHIAQMAGLLQEFGCPQPVLLKDNVLCDGHLRIAGAQKLGWETIPAIEVTDWTESQVKSYRITSRQSAQWSEFDDELLALEYGDLRELDFDMSLFGFDDDEFEAGGEKQEFPPENFKEYDDNIETEYCCPKCSYEWSGKPK